MGWKRASEGKGKMEVMKHSNKEGKKKQETEGAKEGGGLCRGTETDRMQNEREHRKNKVASWLRESEGGNDVLRQQIGADKVFN